MAIHPNLARSWYEKLSVEELESEYNKLRKEYEFNSKEEYIADVINNYLKASRGVNNSSRRIALETLLKERTGKDYSIKNNNYVIELNDIIKYISNNDPFWETTINNYFQKLNISENDKKRFLIELIQDNSSFNEFTKEIMNCSNAIEIYERYQKIAEEYINMHRIIG